VSRPCAAACSPPPRRRLRGRRSKRQAAQPCKPLRLYILAIKPDQVTRASWSLTCSSWRAHGRSGTAGDTQTLSPSHPRSGPGRCQTCTCRANVQQLLVKASASCPNIGPLRVQVFIPLTRLCRDACAYCTFAQPPRAGRRAYMTLQEVLEVARAGAEAGCSEALFTLGDKPEERWPEAAAELRAMGYSSTLEYVERVAEVRPAMCAGAGAIEPHKQQSATSAASWSAPTAPCASQATSGRPAAQRVHSTAAVTDVRLEKPLSRVHDALQAVMHETGLLPHINAGVMSEEWCRRLKRVCMYVVAASKEVSWARKLIDGC
jgi:hypothetical protein